MTESEKLLQDLSLYPGNQRPRKLDTCFYEFLPREYHDGMSPWNPDAVLLHEEALGLIFPTFTKAIPHFDPYEYIRISPAEAAALAAGLREISQKLREARSREEAAKCLHADYPLRPDSDAPWSAVRDTLADTFGSLSDWLDHQSREAPAIWILGL